MNISKAFADKAFEINGSKIAKIALATVLALAALVWFSGTDIGARTLLKIGIKDSFAQTVGAAERNLQKTGDALKSFIGRSPGERGATDVLKGKAARTDTHEAKGREVGVPEQRALGKVFDKPIETFTESPTPQPFLEIPADDTGSFGAPVPALASVTAPTNPRIFAPIIGGFGGGGGGSSSGGGGGSSGGDVGVPPTVPPITSAVPEPSSWAMLLFGFGFIGAVLRMNGKTGSFRTSRRAGPCRQS